MNTDYPSSFHHWLSVVVDDLPPDAVQIVSSEFMSHFMDAVDDFMEEGLSQKQAQTRALTNLGEAEAVSRGLKDVHLGRRHYKTAAFASVLILAVMVFLPVPVHKLLTGNPLAERVGSAFVDILIACLTAYVLNTLRRLLVWRFAMLNLDKLFRIAIGSYLLWLAADALSLMFYNGPLYLGSLRALNEAVTGLDKSLITAAWIGQIGLGTTGMIISWSLWQSQDNLYGISKLLAVSLAIMAIPIGTSGIAVNVGMPVIVALLALFATIGHMLIWPIISMLFVRAIFRPPNARPTQLA